MQLLRWSLDCTLGLLTAVIRCAMFAGFNKSFPRIALRRNDHVVLEIFHVSQLFSWWRSRT